MEEESGSGGSAEPPTGAATGPVTDLSWVPFNLSLPRAFALINLRPLSRLE
jgi:hypothetical protein